jgi:phosphatidylinositol kinase/protein kinase (PI-3  family)
MFVFLTWCIPQLTEDGRLFHIDFGHFLGNFKAKFGVKREAAPFIFTPHMAAVMGGAQPAGFRYLQFQELCVRAFLVLRRHSNLLLALFSLLVDCGIPELQTVSDLAWMDDALMSEMTEADAAAAFLGLLTEALNCRTTRVNHALHILAKH